MRVEIIEGKYGRDDKIILFTSTDRQNAVIERERISIFKLAVLANQITFNELNVKNGYKKMYVERGDMLFIEEAFKEAIQMAKDGINWAEIHNWPKVIEWAEKWRLKPEKIEPELRRTFQRGLDEFED